ncbi:MAG: nucleotidyltransferase family protein [Gammaproteobacteria bacterium]|nr:nucleotidyltransferase family protein [Gammaproteobacteria bacterium]
MKAMILAAGRGDRMRPLTDTTPKPLLKVGEKSLIEYHIEALKQSGVDQLVINTGWLGEKIRMALGNGGRYGVSIEYSIEPETAYETGGGICHALALLSDPFIVVNGDIWTDYDFSNIQQPKGLAHLVLVDNPPQHPQGDFAIDDGLARSEGNSRLTFSGIGCYQKSLFDGLEADSFPLAPVLKRYMLQDKITAEYYTGTWNDVGTPERLTELDQSITK